jgi:dipeptidyl aminopeptidase/acylaminoacyl peptidase
MTAANRLAIVFIAGVLSLAATTVAEAQSFTLTQVMSAPFDFGLMASPKSAEWVWIANQQGRRNLWISGPSGGARSLTRYDADDGIEIGDVTWTPDGANIIYVRGGDFEFPEKPAPNPALLPGGVQQQIWMVPAKGGEPQLLASGQDPAVSADGHTVAYLLQNQIWTVDLRNPNAKPLQILHTRGDLSSLKWSPDGTRLALVSDRGDHSFIGVYSLPENKLLYLDPSTEKDDAPVWSPDSQHVAFVRVPPDTSGIGFKPRRSAMPWSLVVADAATGGGRTIWTARSGPGSVFHGMEGDPQLSWAAADRIVFPWEGDGWLHLYSITASGGEPKLLTPGDFEVDYAALRPGGRMIVYSSNQAGSDPADTDRRHLWEVSADGGTPRQLTHGAGLEVVPAPAPDGSLAVLRSDARVPIRPALVESNGAMRDLAPQMIPADFPAAKLVVPKQVIFNAADGMQIHGQLFLPASAEDGQRHPAVVFFHGGSRRQMLLGWHSMDYYSNAYAMNQYLASRGYIVLSVNYRSGTGYGLNFREALNYGAAGASEFNDVQGAGLYLRSRPDVDGAHIGVWGGSYGGYLTALALARASDLFAAGVDLHGVHDWNLELNIWQPGYDDATTAEAKRIAWESSPLASIKTWRSPVLLIQGDDDRNVQFSQTVRLAEALREQGTPFEDHVFPDEIHGFLLQRDWITAYTLGSDFFDKYLKGK